MNTGELMSRIGEDAETIWETIGYGLRLFVKNIIYFVLSSVILFGDIEFKNVSFKYKDEEVLKDINLKIPAGSTVAIMGTTGSGKTSLINLIGRYYDVCDGEVLIDGVNVQDYNLNALLKVKSIIMI